MDIKPLIEYQKYDINIKKVDNALRNDKTVMAVIKLKNKEKSTSVNYKEDKEELEKLQATFTELEKLCTKMEEEFAEYSDEINEGDEQVVSYMLKHLVSFKADVKKNSAEVNSLSGKISELEHKILDEKHTILKTREELAKIGERADNILKEGKKQMTELAKQQKQLEGNVDAELLKLYNSVKAVKKNPPYIAQISGECCTACGLELNKDVISKLNTTGAIEKCGTCGTLIYK